MVEKNEKKIKEKSKSIDEKVHKSQLKGINKLIDDKEVEKDAKISEEAHKKFMIEEGREKPKTESREERFSRQEKEKLDSWVPKTELGREVKSGKIKNIDEIFDSGRKIMEPEIVDILIPDLKTSNLLIGQAKGKFGGGKRREFRQTQRKTKEGNVLTFGVMAVVGNCNGYMGVGYGRASETLPARKKAIRKAKLNLNKIIRGCGSYDCSCNEEHSIPLAIEGKCSSVRVKLIPAPQGTGLVIGDEMKKILKLAGIKDIYSKCFGKVRTTFNAGKACIEALNKIGEIRI